MGISTHVLDTAAGRPAAGVEVVLSRLDGSDWTAIGEGTTNADGRVGDLYRTPPEPGTYRVAFAVGAYFASRGADSFYPEVTVVFRVAGAGEHFHVPLLLSPFGYTTYRGS